MCSQTYLLFIRKLSSISKKKANVGISKTILGLRNFIKKVNTAKKHQSQLAFDDVTTKAIGISKYRYFKLSVSKNL